MNTTRNSGHSGEVMNFWWPLVGGAVTGIVIAAVQRRYPDASFLALVGVGLGCGGIFNLLIWAVSKKARR